MSPIIIFRVSAAQNHNGTQREVLSGTQLCADVDAALAPPEMLETKTLRPDTPGQRQTAKSSSHLMENPRLVIYSETSNGDVTLKWD